MLCILLILRLRIKSDFQCDNIDVNVYDELMKSIRVF
jgi:hypothetical protein